MIHSSYNQEENILTIDRKDEIKMKDLFALVEDTVSNYRQIRCLYILDDARNSTPLFSSRDYPELSKRVSEGLENFLEVRHAILVDSPMNTALGILFEGMTKEIPSYSFKTFFSKEEGMNWLREGDHFCD